MEMIAKDKVDEGQEDLFCGRKLATKSKKVQGGATMTNIVGNDHSRLELVALTKIR